MERIGVILCSKSKQDYPCSVREMYDVSISFKARRIFMDLVYCMSTCFPWWSDFVLAKMDPEKCLSGLYKQIDLVYDYPLPDRKFEFPP